MPKTYYFSLVSAYLLGDDLDGYVPDVLENNPQFMIEVLRTSHDEKMYQFCSDAVKANSVFVKFVVDTFKDKPDFVKKVADYYFENAQENELIYFDIMINLAEVYGFEEYAFKMYTVYAEERMRISTFKKSLTSDEELYELGIGFCVIEHTYGGSETLLRYMTKCLLNDILLDELGMTFEEFIHSKFKNYEELESYGIRRFLIEYINTLDYNFADYVAVHVELLNHYVDRVRSLFKRWEAYEANLNIRREEIVFKAINEFEDGLHEYYVPTIQILWNLLGEKNLRGYYKELEPFIIGENVEDNFLNLRFRLMLSQLLDELYSQGYIARVDSSFNTTDTFEGIVLNFKN